MQPSSKIGWMNLGKNSLIGSATLPKPFKSFEVSKIEMQLRCGTKKMRQTLDGNISNIICHKAKPQNTF